MLPRCGPIPTYAIFYSAGLIAQLLLVLNLAPRFGVRRQLAWAIGLLYTLGMVVGAKTLYDLLHGSFSWHGLIELQRYVREGGMWGGPLAYLALAVPVVVVAGRSAAERRAGLDLIALTLPPALILAKLGCLCQGCCAGKPCAWPWALRFHSDGSAPPDVPLHPTQAYEILVLVVVLVALLWLHRSGGESESSANRFGALPGSLLAWFILLYGLGRAFVEIWRGDRAQRFLLGPVTVSQAVLLTGGLMAAIWLTLRRRRPAPVQGLENVPPATTHAEY